MGLPKVALPTDIIEVAGEKVEVRGLSRSEVLKLSEYNGDPDAAENYILAIGANVSIEEATDWRNSVPADVVSPILERIVQLSGLDELGKA